MRLRFRAFQSMPGCVGAAVVAAASSEEAGTCEGLLLWWMRRDNGCEAFSWCLSLHVACAVLLDEMPMVFITCIEQVSKRMHDNEVGNGTGPHM